MIFYANPKVLLDELEGNSILISEHRYTKDYDQSVTSGRYCVQFMCFKNNGEGMNALHWWRDRCLEWCYARAEDGKFGDQKYLDDWTKRFSGVPCNETPGRWDGSPGMFSNIFLKMASLIWSKKNPEKRLGWCFSISTALNFLLTNWLLVQAPFTI